jgi:phosphatidylserine synthase
MLEKLKQIPEEWTNFFVKVVLVSLLAISVKIAVEMKKGGVKAMNVILSIIIGVGTAMLFGNLILHYFSSYWATIHIAAITILGEKIASWLIYKAKIDEFMETLLKNFLKYLIRKK